MNVLDMFGRGDGQITNSVRAFGLEGDVYRLTCLIFQPLIKVSCHLSLGIAKGHLSVATHRFSPEHLDAILRVTL